MDINSKLKLKIKSNRKAIFELDAKLKKIDLKLKN
jgi:hypothetical protein